MEKSEAITKVAELMRGVKIGTFTSLTADGQLVSRPMAIQEVEFDGDLWFFTYDSSSKIKQIAMDPSVNVALQKDNSWISLSGNAEVVHDMTKAEELWSKPLKAWFPNELQTEGLILIKVHGLSAEYWDSNSNKITYALKLAKAMATDSQPDVGDNETVRLDEK